MAVNRTKFAYINIIFSLISALLKMVLAFFVQRQLVEYLGYDLVGVNRTCTSIISMMSVAELGLGSAITFCLYKPLAQDDQRKIALFVRLYRNIYLVLAAVITVGVVATMPFIKKFTQSGYPLGYLCLVYGLFALNTVLSYLFSYNQTLLVADQREYVTNGVTMVTSTLMYVAQFVLLYSIKFFADKAKEFFVLYLIAAIAFTLLGNVILYVLVRKRYPYIGGFKGEKLDKQDTSLIKKKVGALIYHRVGNYLVTGTDTLIITGFLSSTVSGITGNYYTITTSLSTILGKIPGALLPGFGNLVVDATPEKIYSVYKKAQLPLFVIYSVAGIGATCLSNLFISRIWLDSTGLMDTAFVILMGTTFFISGYTNLMGSVRFAAGVFEPDKYLHIVIAALNLIISIILVKYWGAAGVLVGTLICQLIKECTALPYICSKYVFAFKTRKLLIRQWIDFAIYAALCTACWFICGSFTMQSAIVEFILKGMICVALPAAVICLIYCRSEAMKYYIDRLKNIIKRITNRGKINENN